MKILKFFIAILMLATMANCKNVADKTTNTVVSNTTENVNKLPVKHGNLPLAGLWIIESFNDKNMQNITKNSQIVIDEDLKRFGGKASCNSIGGELQVSGNAIKFVNVFSTKMMCEEMAQEQLFLQNLNLANTYKIVGAELFLYKNQQLLMTLECFR